MHLYLSVSSTAQELPKANNCATSISEFLGRTGHTVDTYLKNENLSLKNSNPVTLIDSQSTGSYYSRRRNGEHEVRVCPHLPLTGPMISDTPLNHSVPQFPHLERDKK